MIDRAYCKVNLALDVFNKREDGYHDLRSIMVACDFFDEIEILKSEKNEYIDVKNKLQFNSHNTLVKAVDLMKESFDIKDNFKIIIDKHIPIKAGLAGGTADGAAVIRMLNKMYNLNLSFEQIRELCLKIGSDVLFNYYNKPALVEGTGDKIEFIDIKDDYYVLIVKPRRGVSTRKCYEILDVNNCEHPDIDLIKERLKNGEEVKELLKNSLEKSAAVLCKDINKAINDLKLAGADFTMVSGSGSSVFTIDLDKNRIEDIRKKLLNKGYFVRSTKILK